MSTSPARQAAIRRIHALAAQIERDERYIKEALLAFARAGDCASVIEFTKLWQTKSSSWIVACIRASRLPRSKPPRLGGASR